MSSVSIHSTYTPILTELLENSIELRMSRLASRLKEPTADSCLAVLFPDLLHHKNLNSIEFHVYATLEAAAAPFNEAYLTKRLNNIQLFGFKNAFAILTSCIHLARFSGNQDKISFFQNRLRVLVAAHPEENHSLSLQPERLAFNSELVNPQYREVLEKSHATRAKLEQNRYYFLGCIAVAGIAILSLLAMAAKNSAGFNDLQKKEPKFPPLQEILKKDTKEACDGVSIPKSFKEFEERAAEFEGDILTLSKLPEDLYEKRYEKCSIACNRADWDTPACRKIQTDFTQLAKEMQTPQRKVEVLKNLDNPQYDLILKAFSFSTMKHWFGCSDNSKDNYICLRRSVR